MKDVKCIYLYLPLRNLLHLYLAYLRYIFVVHCVCNFTVKKDQCTERHVVTIIKKYTKWTDTNLEKLCSYEKEKTKEIEKNQNIPDGAVEHLEMVQQQISSLNQIRKEISEITIKFKK